MVHYAKQVHEFTGSAVHFRLVEEGFLVRRAAAALAKELRDPEASRAVARVSFVPVGPRGFGELCALHRGSTGVALALVLGEWERLRQYASPGAQTTAVHGSVQRGAVLEAGAADALDPSRPWPPRSPSCGRGGRSCWAPAARGWTARRWSVRLSGRPPRSREGEVGNPVAPTSGDPGLRSGRKHKSMRSRPRRSSSCSFSACSPPASSTRFLVTELYHLLSHANVPPEMLLTPKRQVPLRSVWRSPVPCHPERVSSELLCS
ncbi:unnamed protein product [Prorocentrum cordatum]|nr:unnamed protein product [Polarella glacialis]